MRSISKRLFVICLLALSFTVGGTLAYFTSIALNRNVLTVGEDVSEYNGSVVTPKKLEAGDNVYDAKIRVKNSGKIPNYIRTRIVFSDSDIAECSEFSSDGTEFFSVDLYPEHLPEGWVYISDDEDPKLGGYYYYTEAVEPGDSTPYLMNEINTSFANAEAIHDYDIYVYCESIQINDSYGEIFEGTDAYKDAWSEFLERS